MTNSLTTTTNTPLKPYLTRFALIYAGCTIVIAAIVTLFAVEIGSGASMGSLIAATALAAQMFVQNNGRVPVNRERIRFALLATFVTWLISLVLAGIVIAMLVGTTDLPAAIAEYRHIVSENIGIAVLAIAFVTLLQFAVLYWSMGFFARTFLKQQAAK